MLLKIFRSAANYYENNVLRPRGPKLFPQYFRPIARQVSKSQPFGLYTADQVRNHSKLEVQDIVFADGVHTYSLGTNVDVQICDGKIIVNNTIAFSTHDGLEYRMFQLFSRGSVPTPSRQEIMSVVDGEVNLTRVISFSMRSEVTGPMAGRRSIRFSLVNGYLSNPKTVSQSLLIGNGVVSEPVGELRTQGVKLSHESDGQAELAATLVDDESNLFVWKVIGETSQIESAYNEIEENNQYKKIPFRQLLHVARTNGLCT